MSNNIIVDKVARMVCLGRDQASRWDTMPDANKGVYRAYVQEVLLAAMSAGLRIQEMVPVVIRECSDRETTCDICGVSAVPLQLLEFADENGERHRQTLCRQCKGSPLP